MDFFRIGRRYPTQKKRSRDGRPGFKHSGISGSGDSYAGITKPGSWGWAGAVPPELNVTLPKLGACRRAAPRNAQPGSSKVNDRLPGRGEKDAVAFRSARPQELRLNQGRLETPERWETLTGFGLTGSGEVFRSAPSVPRGSAASTASNLHRRWSAFARVQDDTQGVAAIRQMGWNRGRGCLDTSYLPLRSADGNEDNDNDNAQTRPAWWTLKGRLQWDHGINATCRLLHDEKVLRRGLKTLNRPLLSFVCKPRPKKCGWQEFFFARCSEHRPETGVLGPGLE